MLRRAVLLLVLVASEVRAAGPFDDPYDLPDAPRPPTLPELTHKDPDVMTEFTLGTLVRKKDETTSLYAQRFAVELPLAVRRWFVGASYSLAAGGSIFQGAKLVGGNFEINARTLWATRTGLAFGGGLSIVAPTGPAGARLAVYTVEDQPPAAQVSLSAATLRPWDVSLFMADIVGARPFIDARLVDGRFVIQFRQGLDLLIATEDTGRRQLWATTAVYVGYRLTDYLSTGIEAFESYLIDDPGQIRDVDRVAITISPSVRLMTQYVQPAVSGFTNVAGPLYGSADSAVGVRLAVTFVIDRETNQIKR